MVVPTVESQVEEKTISNYRGPTIEQLIRVLSPEFDGDTDALLAALSASVTIDNPGLALQLGKNLPPNKLRPGS